jgi:hypothetical protein
MRRLAGVSLVPPWTAALLPVAVASTQQHAVLETQIHRVLLTAGLMLVMYGAVLGVTATPVSCE